MIFRTAADSDRVYERQKEREREERKRRERLEQKCPAAAAAATHCKRRCIDACANITRSPRARWIGRLMPAICAAIAVI